MGGRVKTEDQLFVFPGCCLLLGVDFLPEATKTYGRVCVCGAASLTTKWGPRGSGHPLASAMSRRTQAQPPNLPSTTQHAREKKGKWTLRPARGGRIVCSQRGAKRILKVGLLASETVPSASPPETRGAPLAFQQSLCVWEGWWWIKMTSA